MGQCPCCGGFHEGNGKGGGNHFYVAEVGLGVLTVKNHGNCKPRQFRFEVGCLVTGITEKEQNEIKEGTSAGYIEVRREFEKHVAKILTKDLFCDDSCYGTTGEIAKFSEAALVRRYRELSFVDENGVLRKGKKNGFIEKWLDDDNKRVYDNLDVVPKNCSNKTYNLWRGYPVEGIPSELGKEGDVKPFLELLLVLCGGSENALEYALNWFACLFQRPEEKPITSLVFRGVQGTGKGTFLHLLHALMGKTFHETADPKKDIFGTHANMIEGKKCLALNEADECIMKMYRKLLKSMLTQAPAESPFCFVGPSYTSWAKRLFLISVDAVLVIVRSTSTSTPFGRLVRKSTRAMRASGCGRLDDSSVRASRGGRPRSGTRSPRADCEVCRDCTW